MKKIITILSGILLSLLYVTTVSAASPNWNLIGSYKIAFTCTAGCGGTYTHTMTINVMNMTSGAFSGTGIYDADSSYTWSVTGTVDGSSLNFAVDYTGSNPSYAVNATGTIASNGTLSGTATSNSGQSFTWVNTTGKADMQPVAEITSPAFDGDDVIGTLNLTATYTDDNPAGVQWAVREGTCAAATNTRAGNVDSFSTPYSWTGTIPNKVFSSTIDVSAWTSGDYCFVFNPGESSLERDIRLTRLFDIITDADKDGYGSDVDCNDSNADIHPGAADAICNGVDNDCDGTADDGYVPNESCFLPGVCATGNVASSCTGGVETVCTTGSPSAEICDGLDNDCDSYSDEGLDTDNDGVDGCAVDRCLGTTPDPWTDTQLGVNRYMWSSSSWQTKTPKLKKYFRRLA